MSKKKNTPPPETDEQVKWPPEGATTEGADDRGSIMNEMLKKLFMAGMSAAFLTEETIRTFVGDVKLPKETLNLLIAGAKNSKDEVVNRVGREISVMIQKIDLVSEFSRFMQDHKFKVQMEIEVLPKTKKEDA